MELANYVYLPIKDAILARNQKVNLMGVILEYGLPEKSKGTDWFCTLKITDESYKGHSLLVSVFAESSDKVPNVKSPGDIIRFSQVVMKANCGKVNVFFNKKVAAFALFEGKSGKSFVPYQASSSYSIRYPDTDFITSLRAWLLNFRLDSGTSEAVLPLREIKEGISFNLVCKVLKVYEVSKDAWMLYLWDGTDAPPLNCVAKLNDELENPLRLQLEASHLPRDILCEFPTVGTVLRVFVHQGSEKVALRLPFGWVKLVDLKCEERLGLWYSVLSSSTRVWILSDEDSIVTERQRVYQQRINTKWDRIPSITFPNPSHLTETDHDHVPYTTLMDVLTHPQVASKFRCVVRVAAICPCCVEDFRSPLGTRAYRIRLTLEDPTARIHAILYDEDGEFFFDGYPSMDELTNRRNKLLGISVSDVVESLDAPRNPPWVELCIKSYCLDEKNPWSTRKYRIFDTRLVA